MPAGKNLSPPEIPARGSRMAGVRLFWTTKRWIVEGASLSNELLLSMSDLGRINVLKDRERDRPARSVGLLKIPMIRRNRPGFPRLYARLFRRRVTFRPLLLRGTSQKGSQWRR